MLIDRVGEFGLIKRFKSLIKNDRTVIKGSGDDCAVLKFTENKYQLFTCDMLVEGVDFLPQDDPYLVGRKALAVSLSDIAACAGIGRHCLVSLALPKKTKLKFVDRLFKGMLDLAGEYKINLVGGDLSRARQVMIDISLLGEVDKKFLVLRNGARPKDIIFVTGRLGGSILGKHLSFNPRLNEARFLVKNFKLNSMIDISDGLIQDLGHILTESKVGAVVYEDLIPLAKEASGLRQALYMGEDFELLFTLPQKEARRLVAKRLPDFKPIGEITPVKCGIRLISSKGKESFVRPQGFRHF